MLAPVTAGIDGSAQSLAAAQWAAREAQLQERPLRLVHAWNWHPRQREGEPVHATQRHQARRALRQAQEHVHDAVPGVQLTAEQVQGPATAALLEAAEHAAVLVLGSRGLSAFTGLVVGSVAQGVIANALRPVVLVRTGNNAHDEYTPAHNGSPSTGTGCREVVLGIDLADACDEVIEFAFEAARLRHARLRAVYAWQPPSAIGLGPGDIALVNGPQRAREWQEFLAAVLKVWRERYPQTEVVETVVEGKASTALIEAASTASVLVVGRRISQRPTVARIGPVTQAAVHHAGCPLAVVPHT